MATDGLDDVVLDVFEAEDGGVDALGGPAGVGAARASTDSTVKDAETPARRGTDPKRSSPSTRRGAREATPAPRARREDIGEGYARACGSKDGRCACGRRGATRRVH